MSKAIFFDNDGTELPLELDEGFIAVKTHHETCDYCTEHGIKESARFDGATSDGPWAFMCGRHFATKGRGLGMGIGQILIYTEEAE